MTTAPAHTPPVSPALGALCRAGALLVPLAVTALRVAPTSQWRDDVSVVTSLGFVPFGGEGGPSALLADLLSLIPVGGRVLRAGLVGAVGAGVAGATIYALALAVLGAAARLPRLSPLLALSAALTATLSPAFQREATTCGGALLAVALVLLAVSFRASPGDVHPSRAALVSGMLFGCVLAERRLAAGLLLLFLCADTFLSGSIPSRKTVLAWVTGAGAVWGFFLIPLLVRPMAEHAWIHLGAALSSRSSLLPQPLLDYKNPLSSWAIELGPLALALGLAGLISGSVSRGTRRVIVPMAGWIALSLVIPHPSPSALSEDSLATLDLLATVGLATAAAVGVQTVVTILRGFRVPFAEPAGVLLVVFHFTLVFVAAERTSDIVSEGSGLGTEVWTDEALAALPPNALLLVRSPALAFRLWSARIARGERPDVLVVPLALLGRGSIAERILEEEPATGPLIRDVTMTGKSSEYALTELADARPVYVELDPSWDPRLLTHLRPSPLWLRFVPHTLGRSDRTSALVDAEGRRAFSRVLGVAQSVPGGDRATVSMLGARVREKAIVLAALGDRDSVRRSLAELSRIEPSPELAAKLEEELQGKGRLAMRALLE